MIRSGLVSITFRSLTPDEIITLACRAGLDGIEWGGDVHVPHGDLKRATEVSQATQDAGLEVVSYGSYYRAGPSAAEGLNFRSVIETAQVLGAPLIRVWAGNVGSEGIDGHTYENVVTDLQRITAMAEGADIDIALEHHRNTLTDTMESALRLIEDVDAGNLHLYWQPQLDEDVETREESLVRFLPHLSHIHVFHWQREGDSHQRLPLAEGMDEWRQYVDLIYGTGRDHFAMLEFVRDDDPEQFYADAETLKELLQ